MRLTDISHACEFHNRGLGCKCVESCFDTRELIKFNFGVIIIMYITGCGRIDSKLTAIAMGGGAGLFRRASLNSV